MKVGITLPTLHPWETNEMLLQMCEQMEADSVWVPDHMMGVFHPELWPEVPLSALGGDPDGFFDPFCLGAVVGRLTKIPFGISVTDATRRRAPDVARSALTLQWLCQGGFNLGVGSGEAESLVPFGYPFETPVARTEEFLAELRALLDEGRMPAGRAGRMGIPLESPAGRVRVWVAGHGPRMLRLTGTYGDGWIPAWAMTPDEYGAKREAVAAAAAACGRPPPEAGLLVFIVLGESRERIAAAFEDQPLGKLFALFAHASVWERHGLEHPFGPACQGFIDVIVHGRDPAELRELAPRMPFELVDEVVFCGNPKELTERLSAYADHGLEHVVFGNLTGLVGGMDEIMARMPDFPVLRALLAEL